ncbi:MAG: pyridoxal-phosphate dependent enzyme [Dehalococcoidia bacterium]
MQKSLRELPRARLTNLPTPLQEAKHLSELLRGPKLLFKRDDATGLALGGQKARMLEFPFGDALAKGCDTVVSVGDEDSNLSTFVSAAAAKLGMDAVLVFLKRSRSELQGNALLMNLFDPVMIQTEFGGELEGRNAAKGMADDIAHELQERGRHPYMITYGESEEPLESVGYFYCVQEIMEQLKETGTAAQYLYVANASGLTQAGLTVGAKYFHAPFNITGIMTITGMQKNERQRVIAKIANHVSNLVNAGVTVEPDELNLNDDQIVNISGESAHQISEQCIDAIRLVAKTEGIILDPHYTGKAMAGLINDIRKGRFDSSDTVIFYHTGGVPIIFPHNKDLQRENRTTIEGL